MKIIDVHVYLGKWHFPIPEKSVEELLVTMDSHGVEKAITMSAISIQQDFREGNRKLFDAIDPYDNLYGYCFVNGNYLKESLEQMEKYLPSPKCKGVKYHPEYSSKRPDAYDVLPLFRELAEGYGKPALIHSWPYGEHGNTAPNSHPRFITNLAEQLPELKVVMGHMGGPEWQTALEIVKPYPNVHVDIGSSYTHFDKVKCAVDTLGAYRVLFGSGMTEGCLDVQLGVVVDSEICEEDRRIVLYQAAERLFVL